jgi:thiamine biosynthesis lipoprotein
MSAMGTLVNITIFDEAEAKSREAVRDAFAEIRRVDDLMSTHRRYSQLSRINRAAGNDALAADPRILDVARAAIAWSERTGGVFDATTLPLLRAWGFRNEDARPAPSVEAALEVVGSKFIRIEGDRLGLTRAGAEIDFGGIAKGYAVDRAVARLRDRWGVARAIVEAGGDLYALGRPEDDEGWTIGVRSGGNEREFDCTFKLADAAVATSGSRATRIRRGGEEYGDIFDPRDGRPRDGFLTLTSHAATAMDADALSTAAYLDDRDPRSAPDFGWGAPFLCDGIIRTNGFPRARFKTSGLQ